MFTQVPQQNASISIDRQERITWGRGKAPGDKYIAIIDHSDFNGGAGGENEVLKGGESDGSRET